MQQRSEFYDATYGAFFNEVWAAVRQETYGEDDIGQTGWITADEYRTFLAWLDLHPDQHVLDVGCGSGGPTLFLARMVGGRVTGIDVNERGIATATHMAADAGLHPRVHFQVVDAHEPLPFDPATFDALVCIDAIPHFPDRLRVLRDWLRVLRPGANVLYTDSCVVTGPISSEEIAKRYLSFSLLVPPGANEQLLEQAGFRIVRCTDVTENATQVAARKHAAQQRHHAQIVQLEGQKSFDRRQDSLALVHRLGSEQRLSRMAYVAEKPMA